MKTPTRIAIARGQPFPQPESIGVEFTAYLNGLAESADALTGGLRRNTDMVRGVLERTRGELTTSFREAELKTAIDGLDRKLSQAS